MVHAYVIQRIYSGKKISNKLFLKEYQRYVRKLKKHHPMLNVQKFMLN